MGCTGATIVAQQTLNEDAGMLPSDTRVLPNEMDVAAKVIDGEAIIMNLSNGLYFSMDHVGAAVWELVERGSSMEEMAEVLEGRFRTDRETVLGDVSRLVDELLLEDLVRVTEAASNGKPDIPVAADDKPYQAPVLNKYSDMADLLALDPPMPGLGDTPEKE